MRHSHVFYLLFTSLLISAFADGCHESCDLDQCILPSNESSCTSCFQNSNSNNVLKVEGFDENSGKKFGSCTKSEDCLVPYALISKDGASKQCVDQIYYQSLLFDKKILITMPAVA